MLLKAQDTYNVCTVHYLKDKNLEREQDRDGRKGREAAVLRGWGEGKKCKILILFIYQCIRIKNANHTIFFVLCPEPMEILDKISSVSK